MRTLAQYVDLAKARQGLESDRQLGNVLSINNTSVHYWKIGRALPTDDKMVQLATLAGIDPAEALLELNQWRAKGVARSVYVDMARRLQGTAASLIVAVSFAASALASFGTPSHATPLQSLDNVAQLERAAAPAHILHGIYIMR